MKSKLNGASVASASLVSTAHLRMLMTEAERVPEPPVSINWTRAAHQRSAEQRRARIAVVAYYLSEARGFAPGHDADDWLLAQSQVDAIDAGMVEG